MNFHFYYLSDGEHDLLLQALLSVLSPDDVRLRLRKYIEAIVQEYKRVDADIEIEYYSKEHINIVCYDHGKLHYSDMAKLHGLEDIYNTIDNWGY